jgi:hypothetical protein
MRFSYLLLVALAFSDQALSAIVGTTSGGPNDLGKSYIVTLKDSASKEAALSNLRSVRKATTRADSKVEEWDNVIHGFSGKSFTSPFPDRALYVFSPPHRKRDPRPSSVARDKQHRRGWYCSCLCYPNGRTMGYRSSVLSNRVTANPIVCVLNSCQFTRSPNSNTLGH